MKKILFFFIFLFSASLYANNNVTVKAEIDSVVMMIGNQANLKFSVMQSGDEFVQFPVFSETITDGIEIIERKKADTIDLGSNRIEINQDYLISAYDSGLYFIPSAKFIIKEDTLESNSLTLKVLTIPVDTANIEIFDIKPVLSPPFSWKNFFIHAGLILLILLILAAIIYVVIRLVNKKSILAPIIRSKPKLPAHIIALEGLDKVKSEKLWQQGREKEFYTDLTDIIRTYIEDRFGIAAMEMTSDEILDEMVRHEDSKSVLDNLRQILKSADLVKFAKMKFSPNENDLSIINSYLFVNQTKIEPVVEIKDGTSEEKNEELEKQ